MVWFSVTRDSFDVSVYSQLVRCGFAYLLCPICRTSCSFEVKSPRWCLRNDFFLHVRIGLTFFGI